jgi:excisionase family DNA binding protein
MAHEASDLMTVTEFAKLIHVTRVTVYRMIERGEIPYLRFGGMIRVKSGEAMLRAKRGPDADGVD